MAVGKGRCEHGVQPEAIKLAEANGHEPFRAANVMVARWVQRHAARGKQLSLLREAVTTDSLTGLASGAPFMPTLVSALAGQGEVATGRTAKRTTKRTSERGMAAIDRVHDLMDVKQRMGRARGDELWASIAALLRQHIQHALDSGLVSLACIPVLAADGRVHQREAVVRFTLADGAVVTGAKVAPPAPRTAHRLHHGLGFARDWAGPGRRALPTLRGYRLCGLYRLWRRWRLWRLGHRPLAGAPSAREQIYGNTSVAVIRGKSGRNMGGGFARRLGIDVG